MTPELLGPAADWLLLTARDVAVLATALLLVERAFGSRIGPGTRYLMWSVLLVRLLVPVLPPDPFGWKPAPEVASPIAHDGAAQVARMEYASGPTMGPEFPPASSPPLRLDREAENAPGDALATAWLEVREVLPPTPVRHPSAADSPTPGGTAVDWRLPLAAVWAIGALLLLSRLLVLEWRFRRAVARDAHPAPEWLQRALDEARADAGLRRPVRAFRTAQVPAPAVCGFLRPRLLLPPTALTRLGDAELRHVLAHEVAHLRAGDTLVSWAFAVARALHWYHPLARLGLRRMQAAQEVLRDYQALGSRPGADPRGYAATVLKLGTPPPTRRPPVPIPAILEAGKDLKQRIQMIIDFPLRSKNASLFGAVLVLGLGWAGLTGASAAPANTDVGPDTPTVQEPDLKQVKVVRQDPVPAWKVEMLAKLQAPITLNVENATILEAVAAIRKQAGVNIVLDPDIDGFSEFDFQAEQRTAAQVLDLLCDVDSLEWGVNPGVVLIGWSGSGVHGHDLRFYRVGQLLLGADEPEWRAEALQELLMTLSWREWETEYASMRYWNGLLVVNQTDRGHERVEELLNLVLNRGRRAAATMPAWRAQMEARLDMAINVNFDEQGFGAVIRALSEQTGIPMYVHPDVAEDQFVTLQLDGLPLREVLGWISRQTYTHVALDDGYVRFRYEPPTEVRMYEVADLIQASDEDDEWAAEELTELVSSGTGWQSWDVEDSSIRTWDGMLIVVQTDETHARIGRFLDALREAL